MRQKRSTPFTITAIDSLGQGVSKITDKVTFIPKTLPGEEGEAEIVGEKKGVAFGRLLKLNKTSEKRIEPSCIHFKDCPSCHFLHMTYEDELSFKKTSYQNLFRKIPLPEVEVIAAPERLHYRNRVQLHYSLKSKLLGLRDPQTHALTPIPKCLIAVSPVLSEVERLYQSGTWLKEAPSAPIEGHVEIYWVNNKLQVTWNRPYAEGGFTQVYEQMNLKLKELLRARWSLDSSELLDLFAGNGNLSAGLSHSNRLCVDIYQDDKGNEFLNQNLYDSKALPRILKELKKRDMTPSALILDPPRSGLRDLGTWLTELKPKKVAYVSCDPHTLARDVSAINGYEFTDSFLLDFFPSTFHFESLIFLKRKE